MWISRNLHALFQYMCFCVFVMHATYLYVLGTCVRAWMRACTYPCPWCEAGRCGCSLRFHCRVSPAHCRCCHMSGQRGHTRVLCRCIRWSRHCPRPSSRTAVPRAQGSTWSPGSLCSPGWRARPLGNKALWYRGDWTHDEVTWAHFIQHHSKSRAISLHSACLVFRVQ